MKFVHILRILIFLLPYHFDKNSPRYVWNFGAIVNIFSFDWEVILTPTFINARMNGQCTRELARTYSDKYVHTILCINTWALAFSSVSFSINTWALAHGSDSM